MEPAPCIPQSPCGSFTDQKGVRIPTFYAMYGKVRVVLSADAIFSLCPLFPFDFDVGIKKNTGIRQHAAF